MKVFSKVWKAIAATIGSGFAAYATAVANGPVDEKAWALIVGSALVTGVITYFSPKNASDANSDKGTLNQNGPTVTKP